MDYPYLEQFNMDMMDNKSIVGSGDAYQGYHNMSMLNNTTMDMVGNGDPYHQALHNNMDMMNNTTLDMVGNGDPYHQGLQNIMDVMNNTTIMNILASGDDAYQGHHNMGMMNDASMNILGSGNDAYQGHNDMGMDNKTMVNILGSGNDAYQLHHNMAMDNTTMMTILGSGNDAYQVHHDMDMDSKKTMNIVVGSGDDAYHQGIHNMEMMNDSTLMSIVAGSGDDAYHHHQGPLNMEMMNDNTIMSIVAYHEGGQHSMGMNMNNGEIVVAEPGNSKARKGDKKKRFTQSQSQQLEELYSKFPYPNEEQRLAYCEATGLTPLQMKFWFQNKRTQMKRKIDREENLALELENRKIEAENMLYKEALAKTMCINCRGETNEAHIVTAKEFELLSENMKLTEKVEILRSLVAICENDLQMNSTIDDGGSSTHDYHINQ